MGAAKIVVDAVEVSIGGIGMMGSCKDGGFILMWLTRYRMI